MGFHEQARDARRDCGAREHRHKFALPARARPLPARQLHAVGRVEHHRAAGFAHDRQAAHVGDQIVVAERGAALAHHDRLFVDAGRLGRAARLVDDIDHVVRRHELRFLDVDRLARGSDGVDEVGLAGEEGGRLEHVDDLGDRRDLRDVVDVGQDRHAERVADFLEDSQAFVHARPAKALVRRAVGLVEARLEDEVDAELAGDRLERLGGA